MKTVTNVPVLSLFNAPTGLNGPIARVAAEKLCLVAGKGIEGHKRYGKTRTRQINIVEERLFPWFEASFGRTLEPGATGENVIVGDRLDLGWLELGAHLRLGTALLELRMYRAPCKPMADKVGAPTKELFVGHVGILCEVVESGEVAVGDSLTLLSTAGKNRAIHVY